MKLHESLAQNHSIRLQAEAETWQGGGENRRRSAGGRRRGGTALLPGDPRRRRAARPLFCDRSGISHAARAAGRGRQKTGFALVTLKKPLIFNHEDNDPVDILITMAAVDATTHQEVGIMQIVNLFDDEANFDRLRACRSEQEVLDLIKNATAAAV